MRTIRIAVAGLGGLVALYGVKLLLDLGSTNLVATGKWLLGGVVLHDGLVGPATIAVVAAAGLLLRRSLPAPVIVGGVVVATVTVVAIPVLGRFGAHADNPTLLDRSYGVGWLAFAGLTLLLVGASLVRSRLRIGSEGGDDGTSAGG